MNPQTERFHPSRGYTPSPAVAVAGHNYCECGIPEPVVSCSCDRLSRAPLELGSCNRCRFWLRHLKSDHRPWYEVPEEQKLYEQAMGRPLKW